jgi:hypothetical protein
MVLSEDGESEISTNPSLLVLPSAGKSTLWVDEAFSDSALFDLERLADISSSQLKSAKDHISLIQTDPAYMRRYVQLLQESGYSKLPDKVIFVMMTKDLDYETWSIRHWSWIAEEISELKQIQANLTDQIQPGRSLPPKYGNKLASFGTLIFQLLDVQSRRIQGGLPYRPGFEQHYSFECTTVDGRAHMSHSSKSRREDPVEQSIENAEAFMKYPLQWCILCLTTDPDAPGVFDRFRLLEFLDQHLSKASAEERARVDETLLRKISDLAAFNELLALVRSHKPTAVRPNLAEITTSDQGTAWRFLGKAIPMPIMCHNGKEIVARTQLQDVDMEFYSLGPLLKAFMLLEPPENVSDSAWVAKDTAQ